MSKLSKLQDSTRDALVEHLKATGGRDCDVRVITATNTSTGETLQAARCEDHQQLLKGGR